MIVILQVLVVSGHMVILCTEAACEGTCGYGEGYGRIVAVASGQVLKMVVRRG
jgi:hypothetical protein